MCPRPGKCVVACPERLVSCCKLQTVESPCVRKQVPPIEVLFLCLPPNEISVVHAGIKMVE